MGRSLNLARYQLTLRAVISLNAHPGTNNDHSALAKKWLIPYEHILIIPVNQPYVHKLNSSTQLKV